MTSSIAGVSSVAVQSVYKPVTVTGSALLHALRQRGCSECVIWTGQESECGSALRLAHNGTQGIIDVMAITTRVLSVTVPVPDQERALEFYRDVLGCEVRYDGEPWPGARMIEVVPPGSSVGIVLLPPDSEIPVAVRMATSDANAAYRQVKDAGVTTHNDGPITIGDGSPMFFFDDPFGNGLVYIQEQ